MKATVEALEGNKVVLHIEVEEPEMAAAMEQAYRKVAQRVTVPGFRKGRAPRPLLDRHVGKGVVMQEALEQLMPDLYQQAVAETGIEPIDRPEWDVEEYVDEKPLKLKAAVEVVPKVTLREYKGLAVERTLELVAEADVDKMIEQLRENHAQLVDADHETVQQGDFVSVDYTGFVGKKPFPGGAAKEIMLEVGSDQFLPGFTEQLVGVAAGDDCTVKVTLPADYHVSKLAGQEAEFQVKVRGIKSRQVPVLDDEFAKDVGEFETVEDLRRQVRTGLERQAAARADQQMRNILVAAVADKAEVEVPAILVAREVDRRALDFAQRLIYQGVDPTRFLDENNAEAKSLRESMKPQAEAIVRQRLALAALAKKEGIVVAPDEVDAEIERMVSGDTAHAEEMRQRYAEPARRADLTESLRLEKAVQFLVQNAVITEKTIERPVAENAQVAAPEEHIMSEE